jgi:hypothetical protein
MKVPARWTGSSEIIAPWYCPVREFRNAVERALITAEPSVNPAVGL